MLTAQVDESEHRHANDQLFSQQAATIKSNDLSEISGTFATIVVDPPWQVQRISNPTGEKFQANPRLVCSKLDYPTLTVDEIAGLPVGSKADENAHLYLWTINKYIEQSYEVARSWGFKPSTMLFWLKQPAGLVQGGAYVPCVEPILFCRRGKLPPKQRSNRNWWGWPRGRHSQKPEGFQTVVESVSPGPYLELFARRSRPGWVTWGNEV